MGKKVYAIVNPSLSDAQKAVQASHALVELCLRHPALGDAGVWGHQSLVLLQARSHELLMETERALPELTPYHASFREPHYGGLLTAIAFLETEATQGATSGLPLMIKTLPSPGEFQAPRSTRPYDAKPRRSETEVRASDQVMTESEPLPEDLTPG